MDLGDHELARRRLLYYCPQPVERHRIGLAEIQRPEPFLNIKSTLEKLGASMSDIVDETMFVTDVGAVMADLEQFASARAEAYGGEPQASQTLVQVAALVMPALMIEIKCVAIR